MREASFYEEHYSMNSASRRRVSKKGKGFELVFVDYKQSAVLRSTMPHSAVSNGEHKAHACSGSCTSSSVGSSTCTLSARLQPAPPPPQPPWQPGSRAAV